MTLYHLIHFIITAIAKPNVTIQGGPVLAGSSFSFQCLTSSTPEYSFIVKWDRYEYQNSSRLISRIETIGLTYNINSSSSNYQTVGGIYTCRVCEKISQFNETFCSDPSELKPLDFVRK